MTEARKTRSKPKASAESVVRQEDASVGEILKACRLSKDISLEEVSASIHVRSAQLRAIEEGNISALPGMTYAVGFVRSYANFLGLNGIEIVHKFKAENGQPPTQLPLSFPEPLAESRMPDPMMIGIGAFLAILVLMLWTFYSSTNDGSKEVAAQIPPAPVATTTADAPMTEPLPVPVVPVAPVPAAAVAAADLIAPSLPPVDSTQPVSADLKNVAVAEPIVKLQPPEVAPVKVLRQPAPKALEGEDMPSSVINVKRGKGRIILQANQASWVQVSDVNQGIIYKKVLRPGEQYDVPDQPGLSLVTANAGGLDIYVDGEKVQPIGRPGEIMRGIILDPTELKIKKIKVRN